MVDEGAYTHTQPCTHFIGEAKCVRQPCMKSTELHVFIVNAWRWKKRETEKETAKKDVFCF